MHPGALARRRAEALERMAGAAIEIAEKLNDPAISDLAAKIARTQGPNEEVRALFRTEALAEMIVLINEKLLEPITVEGQLEEGDPPEGVQDDGQGLPPVKTRNRRQRG